MVGSHHKGFLVTAVERKTKHTLVGISQKKDADSVKKELISMFKPIKECVKTITADNGKEFAGHDNEPIKQSTTENFRLQITKNII